MPGYQEAIRRRLALIEGMGTDAVGHTQARIQRRRLPEGRYGGNFLAGGFDSETGLPPLPDGRRGGKLSGNSFDAFMNAISGQESGGNYGAVNRHSGAAGKYQIMPANVGAWSREALGRSVGVGDFLRNPQLQEQIAKHKLQQYYNQFGPAGAAVAWYAGPGNAKKYVANPKGWNKPQKGYPSIASYASSILRRMGLA